MKRKCLTILCALALLWGTFPHALAEGEDQNEIIAPPGWEQTEPTGEIAEGGETPATDPELPPATESLTGTDPTPGTVPSVGEPSAPLAPWAEPFPEDPAALSGDGILVLVGLAYKNTALDGANLANAVGNGYRFGYLDERRVFWPVGYTSETAISVVKTQNVYYGIDPQYSTKLKSYSDQISSDIGVGCWHVQLPTETAPGSYEEALELLRTMGQDGFPAWIDGVWQLRIGAYTSQEEAQAAASMIGGTAVGTSAYGISVVETGTARILFQFDGGEALSLAVAPGLDNSLKCETHFRGERYYGIFQFCRVKGGDLVVSNLVTLEDYTNSVISREMSSSWPIEALKAQAVSARSYYEDNLGKHASYGFDICSTTDCQVYFGMAQTNERTLQAARETAALRAWYQGEPAKTFYFASDGGGTENVKNVWGSSYPYLCGVIDPYEETISDKIAYWDHTVTFTSSQLTNVVQSKGYNCAAIVDFEVAELTPTGNVKTIIFTDANGKEYPFTQTNAVKIARNDLGLKSIRYSVTKSGERAGGSYYTEGGNTLPTLNGAYAINGSGAVGKLSGNPYVITSTGEGFLPAPTGGEETGEVLFTVTSRGNGHSIGMSQWGAYAMAQQGFTFDQILKFYYPGIEIY